MTEMTKKSTCCKMRYGGVEDLIVLYNGTRGFLLGC